MAKPARKKSAGKPNRRGDRERGARNGEGSDPQQSGAASLSGGEQVSSLLETTGEEVKQLLEAADDAAKKIREAARGSSATAVKDEEGSEVSTMIAETNTEVRQVLETADEAAEKIREEARAEARLFIEDARRRAETVTAEHVDRVERLSDEVLTELTKVREHVGSLRGTFDRALQSMRDDLGVEQTEVWAPERNGAGERDPETAELRGRLGRRQRLSPPTEPAGVSEGARLLAMQQLMAGVDAKVIERRLKEEFGVEDPGPLLDWMGVKTPPGERAKKP